MTTEQERQKQADKNAKWAQDQYDRAAERAKQGYLYRCVVCGGTKPGEEMKTTVSSPKDPHGTCRDCWDDDDGEPSAYANVVSRFARLEGQARSARTAAQTVAEMAAAATKQAAEAEAEVKRLSK